MNGAMLPQNDETEDTVAAAPGAEMQSMEQDGKQKYGMQIADAFANCINMLTPAEQAELDSYITPRFVDLMAKMFGEEIRPVMEPYITDEEDLGEQEGEEPVYGGDEAVPYTSTPISQVKSMGYTE